MALKIIRGRRSSLVAHWISVPWDQGTNVRCLKDPVLCYQFFIYRSNNVIVGPMMSILACFKKDEPGHFRGVNK